MQLTTRRHLPPQSCCIHSQESGLTTHVRVRARAGASGKVEAYDIEITAADSLPSVERRARESASRSRRANESEPSRDESLGVEEIGRASSPRARSSPSVESPRRADRVSDRPRRGSLFLVIPDVALSRLASTHPRIERARDHRFGNSRFATAKLRPAPKSSVD